MRRTSEKEVQQSILEAARACGWTLWHFDAGAVRKASRGVLHSAGGSAPNGWPDLAGCTSRGQLAAIEVKKPGEKPRADQLAMLRLIRACGGVAAWFDNVKEAVDWMIFINQGARECIQ